MSYVMTCRDFIASVLAVEKDCAADRYRPAFRLLPSLRMTSGSNCNNILTQGCNKRRMVVRREVCAFRDDSAKMA